MLLRLEKTGELFSPESGLPVRIPHCALTSAVLTAVFPILITATAPNQNDWAAAEERLQKKLSFLGLPTLALPQNLKAIKILHWVVENWIVKRDFPPELENMGALSKDAVSMQLDALMAIKRGIREAPVLPRPSIGSITRIHLFDKLIPACWAEIWYAMDAFLPLRCCPYCGEVFKLPRNRIKSTCQKAACKMQYEIDRHGGSQAYREWEKQRKLNPGKKPVGRPKKNVIVENTIPLKKRRVGRPRKDDDE